MSQFICTFCGYAYNHEKGAPEQGVDAGTPWEDVQQDFSCPVCGLGKEMFHVNVVDEEIEPENFY